MVSSKPAQNMAFPYLLVVFILLIGFGSSDVNQDKAECQNQLVALAGCLPYVTGDAKVPPTPDCCSGLKQLLQNSKKCLCLLIKDKDDPSVGFKINTTLAANLPTACNAPVNVTECISLLHLDPNSPEAKVFQGFQSMTQGHNSTSSAYGNSTSSGSSAAQKSYGGRSGKRWLGIEIACGVLSWIFFTLHLNSCF